MIRRPQDFPSIRILALLVAAGLLILHHGSVQASRDSTFYPNNWVNPNIKEERMYWQDAQNVIEDISQFKDLYIRFHNCAYSPLVKNYILYYTDDMTETDVWYTDTMPKYGANVAFSLYGTLKNSSSTMDSASGWFGGGGQCNKRTFINSFYTTSGFGQFASALKNAGVYNTGNSNPVECENGYQVTCGSNVHSSELFVLRQYKDGQCPTEGEEDSATDSVTVPDELAEFNAILKSKDAECLNIYSSSSEDDAYLTILENSRSCATYDNVGMCPDPYGKVKLYEHRLQLAMTPWSVQAEQLSQGTVMFVIGGVMLVIAVGLALIEYTKGLIRKRRKQNQRRLSRGGSTKSSRSRRSKNSNRDGDVIQDPELEMSSKKSSKKHGKHKKSKSKKGRTSPKILDSLSDRSDGNNGDTGSVYTDYTGETSGTDAILLQQQEEGGCGVDDALGCGIAFNRCAADADAAIIAAVDNREANLGTGVEVDGCDIYHALDADDDSSFAQEDIFETFSVQPNASVGTPFTPIPEAPASPSTPPQAKKKKNKFVAALSPKQKNLATSSPEIEVLHTADDEQSLALARVAAISDPSRMQQVTIKKEGQNQLVVKFPKHIKNDDTNSIVSKRVFYKPKTHQEVVEYIPENILIRVVAEMYPVNRESLIPENLALLSPRVFWSLVYNYQEQHLNWAQAMAEAGAPKLYVSALSALHPQLDWSYIQTSMDDPSILSYSSQGVTVSIKSQASAKPNSVTNKVQAGTDAPSDFKSYESNVAVGQKEVLAPDRNDKDSWSMKSWIDLSIESHQKDRSNKPSSATSLQDSKKDTALLGDNQNEDVTHDVTEEKKSKINRLRGLGTLGKKMFSRK